MFPSILTSTLCIASALLSTVNAVAIPAPNERESDFATGGKTVAYFGQTRSQASDSLSKFCSDSSVDIIVLAFVHIIKGKGGLPGLNLSGYCGDPIEGTDLVTCPDMGADIMKCQAQGKLVLLSLQGSMGSQTLDSSTAVTEYADSLWKLFGEGKGLEDKRPFGKACIDGFDIDNETHSSQGWTDFVAALRHRYSGASKKYYISAAPQCPQPDNSIGDAVYHVDFLFVQFYNNYCATTGLVSSFNSWSEDIAKKTTVGTKVFAGFLGVPGIGSGYADHQDMISYVSQIRSKSNFGGVMAWDAANAHNNTDCNGRTFLRAMRDSLSSC
ncbi:glycoside hydrolase [Choiromyces venosus 120613-1]|uniref:chitinase n=1 Tax=Choiromyces venosus 120613-1 TaxID=1336337 RepID=A0A3N4KDY6_9PEZI|nr:glycoside hydrolase [Choiromyces venosus 120613-1]